METIVYFKIISKDMIDILNKLVNKIIELLNQTQIKGLNLED